MKTKIMILLLSATVFGLLCGCNDFLNKEPKSDLTKESFWLTESDANVGVIAIYYSMNRAMASGLWNWGEMRADLYAPNEKYGMDQYEMSVNNISSENRAAVWTYLYDVIGKANAAIKYISRIDMAPTVRDHYMAEAHAMRAWAYFYLVRVWGDVPLFLDPIEEFNTENLYRERTDWNHIMERVILPDLETAYYLVDKSITGRKRMNVATILTLQMDAYAWIGDYDKVISIKQDRIDLLTASEWRTLISGGSSFAADWRNLFIESTTGQISKEVYFKLEYSRFANGTHSAISFFTRSTSNVILSQNLTQSYQAVDKRIVQWSSNDDWEERLDHKFWPDNTEFSGDDAVYSDNDLVLYRYADVVLLYAEALYHMGRETDAVTELNRTYTRAGNAAFTMLNFGSSEDILRAILDERKREFVGEGKRWFDLVRNNMWREYTTLTDPEKIWFPIHRDHLIHNPKLTQNPGYAGV